MAGFQKHFEEIFGQARSDIIDGAHHLPQSDDPEAVAATIATWWDDQVAPVYRVA